MITILLLVGGVLVLIWYMSQSKTTTISVPTGSTTGSGTSTSTTGGTSTTTTGNTAPAIPAATTPNEDLTFVLE